MQRLTAEQIIRIWREAELSGAQVRACYRQHRMAEQTFDRWRHEEGGLELAEAVQLRQLERENARLKKLVAKRGDRQGPRASYRQRLQSAFTRLLRR